MKVTGSECKSYNSPLREAVACRHFLEDHKCSKRLSEEASRFNFRILNGITAMIEKKCKKKPRKKGNAKVERNEKKQIQIQNEKQSFTDPIYS